MPRKATIQDVKDFIEKFDTNHECELLSTEYVNSETPLLLRCNVCGKAFERDYHHLKRKRFRCAECGRKSGGGNNKLSLEDVKKFLKENDINHDCELLSTEYINASTSLRFKCNVCGKEFERDFNHVKRGRFRCAQCGIEAGARKLEYTKEYVKKDIFEKAQYRMIGNYVNAEVPFKVVCSLGHEFDLRYSSFLDHHSGCKKCANLNMRGSNHPNWNGGGHQETIDYFRHALLSWKRACLKAADYKCDITGTSDDLIIHHLSNFSDILKNTLTELNIPYYNKISDFSEKERNLVVDELLKKHPLELGVVLDREVHNEFHKIYGKTNNTKE